MPDYFPNIRFYADRAAGHVRSLTGLGLAPANLRAA